MTIKLCSAQGKCNATYAHEVIRCQPSRSWSVFIEKYKNHTGKV